MMLIAYIREHIQNGRITIKKIATEKNPAYILTKFTYGQDFLYKKQQIMGIQQNEPIINSIASKRKRNIEDDDVEGQNDN